MQPTLTTSMAQWLWCCARARRIPGSIPGRVNVGNELFYIDSGLGVLRDAPGYRRLVLIVGMS